MTKKETKTPEPSVPATKESLMPAAIVSQSEKRGADVDLPDFLKEEGAFSREAADGFNPLIDFQERIGAWIIARYVGQRAGIGPNASMMYDFEVVKPDKTFMSASLWGSTILDTKMVQLHPEPGEWVFIQFIGFVETSRKASPAKDFRLRIVDAKKINQFYGG